jgi:propanol-preferring alcohol dehydrogenase
MMARTMKAAVVSALGKPLAIEEVPIPQPNDDQILVRLAATGICHTDLHAVNGDWPVKPKPPFIPGHEGVGSVVAMGRAVRSVKEGDRVGIPWLHTACGYCSYCRSGWETLCGSQLNSGYSVNGSFAEYALADPKYVGRLPSNLEWGPAAPILCAGVTVYKGLKETEVKPGEWVLISGIGGLGHMAVQYAKAMGMHVAAVDVHPTSSRSRSRLVPKLFSTPRPSMSRPKYKGSSMARTVRWLRQCRRRRSSRPSTCCARAAPCRSSACRRAGCRCRSSIWF